MKSEFTLTLSHLHLALNNSALESQAGNTPGDFIAIAMFKIACQILAILSSDHSDWHIKSPSVSPPLSRRQLVAKHGLGKAVKTGIAFLIKQSLKTFKFSLNTDISLQIFPCNCIWYFLFVYLHVYTYTASLPPTFDPGATPTPQTLLFHAAATSPAHLVPCLGNVRSKQLNPSIPRSDQYVTSPYNIHTLSSKQVMRTFQVEVVVLISHQILTTNLQGKVQQLKESINNQSWGIKG